MVILAFSSTQFTRFLSPKVPLAWLGIWIGLIALLSTRPVRSVPLSWLAPGAGLVVWGAISLLWSPAPGRGELALLTWVLALVWSLLLGVLTVEEADQPATAARCLSCWLAAGLLCAGLALVQRLGQCRLGLHQVTGTIGNPNHLAALLLLLLPAARWLARDARSSHRTRALGWIGGVVCAAGLLATGCKSALVALGAMGSWWILRAKPRRRWLLVGAAVGAAGLALLSPGWRVAVRRDLGGRLLINQISVQLWASRPLRGTGLGGFTVAAAPIQGELLASRRRAPWSNLRDPHSLPLAVGTELGLIGLLLLSWWIGPRLVAIWRQRDPGPRAPFGALREEAACGVKQRDPGPRAPAGRCGVKQRDPGPRAPAGRCGVKQRDPLSIDAGAAWIGLLVQGLAETTLLSPPQLLLGLGWLVLARPPAGLPSRTRQPRRLAAASVHISRAVSGSRAVLVLALALAGWGLWRTTGDAAADWHLARGLQAAVTEPQRSAAHLEQAVALAVDPTEALFYRAMALAAAGRLSRADDDLQRSFQLAPSPERATALGNLALRRGQAGAAAAWYRRAIALHPRYTPAHNNLGVAYLELGQRQLARRHLMRARSLRPGDRRVHRAWRLLGRADGD